ncbi:MAG: hypothetical protein ACP5XB_19370, partial [Isosphaeraceae bacterium]
MEPARFCPRCKREEAYLPEEQLCSVCKGPLLPQGYCPICERPWVLAVGKMCPKHEVLLVEQPSGPEGESGEPDSKWVTLETYADDTTALAARLRLESEGITTLLENELMGSRSNLAIATGGVGLKVLEENLADARVILDQNWSIPERADQTADDDEWEGDVKAGVWSVPAINIIIAFVIGVIGLVVYFFRG